MKARRSPAIDLLTLFSSRVRRHMAWVCLALLAATCYAAATAGVIALIEPIFAEVLLAERAPIVGSAPELDPRESLSGAETSEWASRLSLKSWLNRGYTSLKRIFRVDQRSVVYFVPLLMVAVFLLRSLASFASNYSFKRVGLSITTDIRNDLYRTILDQSSRFHARHSSGELVSRIVNDVGIIQTAVSHRVLDLVQQSVTLLLLVALLLSTHLRLGLLCLIGAPIFLYPIIAFGKRMRRTSFRSQERMADLAALVSEGVRGHRVVKAFGMEDFEDNRFRGATGRHLRVNLRAELLSSLSSPVVESVAVIGASGLLIFAAREIRSGDLSAPLLVSFLVNIFWMYEPVRKLNRANLVLQQSIAAGQRVLGVIRLPNELRQTAGSQELVDLEHSIAFESVNFSYGDDTVLHGIDLEIDKGEVVALVGPSGAGKSTLANLLPRFFDPTQGCITIDGVDIRSATLESLRSLIGLVTQETVLFDDTVRNNIAYGRRDLPLDQIRQASSAAYADRFIGRLPDGYDTRIGESGARLSGGEKQRLAIARALLKNAPILILDEATSHLDAESEALVQKALSNLMKGRTTLVIAHRLKTVMNADRIVVLDQGRLVDQGSHHDLLKHDGVYKRLYDLQMEA